MSRRGAPPDPERVARYERGRWSEWVAAALLMAKGYRVLERRLRTPYGEIDLIAVRGRRLAFVEVKQRATQDAAEASIGSGQASRIATAAQFWLSRQTRYRDHAVGLDIIFMVPRRWPQHIPDGLQP
jgi:putative endonuclease